jgi:hypothetical protein
MSATDARQPQPCLRKALLLVIFQLHNSQHYPDLSIDSSPRRQLALQALSVSARTATWRCLPPNFFLSHPSHSTDTHTSTDTHRPTINNINSNNSNINNSNSSRHRQESRWRYASSPDCLLTVGLTATSYISEKSCTTSPARIHKLASAHHLCPSDNLSKSQTSTRQPVNHEGRQQTTSQSSRRLLGPASCTCVLPIRPDSLEQVMASHTMVVQSARHDVSTHTVDHYGICTD